MERPIRWGIIRFLFCTLVTALAVCPALAHAESPLSAQLDSSGPVVITAQTAARYSLFQSVPGFEGAIIQSIVQGSNRRTLSYVRMQDSVQTTERLSIPNKLIAAFRRHAVQVEGANVDTLWCEIELEDGSTLFGRYLAWTGLDLICDTELGSLHFPVRLIDGFHFINVAPGTEVSSAINRDPNPTRLLFAPTARNLKKGQGYFSAYEVFMPSVQYGIGHNISLGGGLSPIMSSEFAMFWVTPKVGIIETETWALAAGILSINVLASNESSAMGIGYGVGTLGTPDKSVTLGLGYGYAKTDSTGEISRDPFFMLGGELRIGKHSKLITENWWPPGIDSPILSFGVRWLFARRISADFALIRQFDWEVFAIPWIDFIVNF